MWRTVSGILGGIVAWWVIATVLDIGLRHGVAGYARGEPTLTFTLTMKIARLAIGVASSLGAGAVTRVIARRNVWAPWVVGGVMLAMFVPEHIHIGLRLPLWYHLFFLGTLAPFVALGARLVAPGRREALA